jgi:hypothetical protein
MVFTVVRFVTMAMFVFVVMLVIVVVMMMMVMMVMSVLVCFVRRSRLLGELPFSFDCDRHFAGRVVRAEH